MSSQILPYLVFTYTLITSGVLSISTEFDLPSARIYTIAGNNRLTQWNKVDPATRETTIEHEDKIRLDCTANYAVQWIYTGDGIPAYTTTNKYSRTNAHGETTSEFISTIVIDPLKEHHTGKYQCSPGEQLDLRTFFYIFVPGQNIFTSLSGRNIVLSKNGSAVTIPCKVSHPNAAVTLEKSEAGNLRRVRVRADDAVTYDPKIGFTLKLNKIESPEGTYVCTARFGSYVRSVEYKVLPYSANYQSDQSIPAKLQNKCKKRCGENAYCDVIDGRETCQCLPEFGGEPDVKCVIKCNAHTDCPSTMSCFVDRQCRSPCIHSAHGCGINAVCRVENHRPVCACPKDWLGDETIQCFNSVQGSESDRSTPEVSPQSPQRPTKTPPTSSGIKCGSNTDCPDDMTCIRATASTTSGKTCVNPCQARRCGVNAECKVSERRSSCECLPGFFGDARLQCDKIGERENNPFSEPLIQADYLHVVSYVF